MASWLLTGCSSDDSGAQRHAVGEQSEIAFNADVWRMKENTRVATIDGNPALQTKDIRIDAYHHGTAEDYISGAQLLYDGGAWKFWDSTNDVQKHYYWPFDGSQSASGATASTLDFVGTCPYVQPGYVSSVAYDGSAVSVSCDMSDYMTSASQSSVSEYLVGLAANHTLATQTAEGGAVPISLKHPFAMVKFAIATASGTAVKINSVSIGALPTAATCGYDGTDVTWSSLTGSAAITAAEELQVGGALTETTPLLVIPSDYGTKTLTVNATWTDWSDVTKDISTDLSFNWQPGYIYTYTLTVTKYALKVDTETFTEQW